MIRVLRSQVLQKEPVSLWWDLSVKHLQDENVSMKPAFVLNPSFFNWLHSFGGWTPGSVTRTPGRPPAACWSITATWWRWVRAHLLCVGADLQPFPDDSKTTWGSNIWRLKRPERDQKRLNDSQLSSDSNRTINWWRKQKQAACFNIHFKHWIMELKTRISHLNIH